MKNKELIQKEINNKFNLDGIKTGVKVSSNYDNDIIIEVLNLDLLYLSGSKIYYNTITKKCSYEGFSSKLNLDNLKEINWFNKLNKIILSSKQIIESYIK